MQYENLSVDQIQEKLQQIEQNRADLERALEERHQQQKFDVVQEVKELIAERGYNLNDIVPLLTGRRRRGAAPKKGGRQYTRYVDPDNPENVYTRGVLPGWMKQKMIDQGYDPTSRDDREAFKANVLQVAE